MNANQAHFPVRALCRMLQVSPSGYYAWQDRPPSPRAMADAVLAERIRAIHAMSDGNYGSPNIHAELRDEDTRVGRKRIARLMRKAGLRGVTRRRGFVVTTRRDPKQRPAPDLVKREFTATDLAAVALTLNTRPRKTLGWRTPAEALDVVLRSTQKDHVATTD